jgi:hypothetical protein
MEINKIKKAMHLKQNDNNCCPISERGGVKVCCQGYKLVSLLVWQYDMRDNPIFGQFF